MKLFLLVAAVSAAACVASADDKKPDDKKPLGPLVLTVVAKTDKYKFDGGGKSPADYKADLDALAKRQKDGKPAQPPKPPAVDLVLRIENVSKEDATIHVGGDSNLIAFELTGGAGVVALNSDRAFTTDFKLPKAVTLAPGKAHEIPVKQLSDGLRGAARYVYWTGPGEYTLTARYQLATEDGGKGPLLQSAPVKIAVTDK
jgi:hypothetical protein